MPGRGAAASAIPVGKGSGVSDQIEKTKRPKALVLTVDESNSATPRRENHDEGRSVKKGARRRRPTALQYQRMKMMRPRREEHAEHEAKGTAKAHWHGGRQ